LAIHFTVIAVSNHGRVKCAVAASRKAGDAPRGRELPAAGGPAPPGGLLILDGACEGDETLRLARQLGYTPIVPPHPNRLDPWELDRAADRQRND
jgi:hypothetical protein